MNVGSLVYGGLVADGAVAAIAGNRVLPVEVGQEVDLPAVAYVVAVGDGVEGSAPLQRVSVTAHCLAHTEGAAHDLADACDGVLHGLGGVAGGTRLLPLDRTNRQPDYNQELNLWVVSLGYEGWAAF